MADHARDVFQRTTDGSWQCRRDAAIEGRYGLVPVKAGQRIARGAAFAGYDDFCAHLEADSHSVKWDPARI